MYYLSRFVRVCVTMRNYPEYNSGDKNWEKKIKNENKNKNNHKKTCMKPILELKEVEDEVYLTFEWSYDV